MQNIQINMHACIFTGHKSQHNLFFQLCNLMMKVNDSSEFVDSRNKALFHSISQHLSSIYFCHYFVFDVCYLSFCVSLKYVKQKQHLLHFKNLGRK